MDCSVLELFYGMDYMLFLGFRRLFLLRSSVIVLFSNFLLLFCVYMLSIFLFLILYSVRSFLLLMCGRVLYCLFIGSCHAVIGFSSEGHSTSCSHTKERESQKCNHFFHKRYSLGAAIVTLPLISQ